MTEKTVNALVGPPPYAVLVKRWNGGEVRIGPILTASTAETMVHWFKIDARGSRPDAQKCVVTVVEFEKRRPHLPLVAAARGAVLAAMEDSAQGMEGPFPNLRDRLCAQHGYAVAQGVMNEVMSLQAAEEAEAETEVRRQVREAREAELRAGVLKVLEAYGTRSAGEALRDIMVLVSDGNERAGASW
ncbi:hypothetical protein ACWD7M_16400 [Streptomyces griseus]